MVTANGNLCRQIHILIQRVPVAILAATKRHRLQKAYDRAEEERSLLVEAGRLLASSLDYETILSKVLRLTIPLLADSCVLHLFEEEPPRNLLVHSVDPAKEELARQLWCSYRPSSDSPDPLWMAMDSGRPQLLPRVPRELLSAMGENGGGSRLLPALEPTSLLAVPLIARERPIGGLLFVRSNPRESYGPQDLPITEELAQWVALAIDNSRLYRAATEAVRARDDFLSVAAHELKTPLTSLKGFAQLTIRQIDRHGMPDPIQLREAMRVIEQESAKLTLLVAKLLDVSRVEDHRLQLETQPTDLAVLLEEVVARVRVVGQRSITLARPPSLMVMADPLRMEQVITNLLDNAVKYSPEGEPVEVDLWMTAPNRACLSVRDHGTGIPPEGRRRIFDRFYQAHRDAKYGGMGLGLYISKHIVVLHGGHIDVEFPSDGGTRFVVTLPTREGGVPPPEESQTA